MQQDNIFWAYTPEEGVVRPDARTLQSQPRCLVCHEALFRRRSHKRTRNGIVYEVRAHFVHYSDRGATTTSNCTPESVEHAAAKQIVYQHHEVLRFQYHCTGCGRVIPVTITGTPQVEKQFGLYRLDVAFEDAQGNTTGCVEILHTHPMEEDKIRCLTESNVAWVEVTTTSLFSAFYGSKDNPVTVDAVRCAIKTICQQCCAEYECLRNKNEHKRQQREKRAEMMIRDALPEIRTEVDGPSDVGEDARRIIRAFCDLVCDKMPLRPTTHHKEEAIGIIEATVCKETRLTFGRHRGRTIEELWRNDATKSYVRWLAGYTGKRDGKYPTRNDSLAKGNTNPNMDVAQDLLCGHCLLCFERVDADWKQWCRGCWTVAEQ